MELRQVKVYDFDELNDSVKEKVLNEFRGQNEHYFLEEDLNEELNILLEENGVKPTGETELRYSLSCCQGDGVSFTGNFKFKGFDFIVEVLSNLYSHSQTTHITTADEYDDDDITEELKEIIEKEFKNIYYEICDKIEEIGYSYIEHNDSEEAIKRNIEVNEYKFLANGDIF